jgi:hypothetical protein
MRWYTTSMRPEYARGIDGIAPSSAQYTAAVNPTFLHKARVMRLSNVIPRCAKEESKYDCQRLPLVLRVGPPGESSCRCMLGWRDRK